ncbi:hypothetical protein EHI8A_011400 [Entamoeba histolytica HM-1:IMSS-B]|uniref:CCZ1/INTU/HSP4 first Longin domain-containing protein n=5 Tax=Entamoeba histolytica TaxID=5759 RepID=C4LTK5_ENTH1|nr:hypothetical protein EHI_012120 [Entamoeba histolytica HM-1:IMSS]EMD43253.1 Hypothetical protein EHI5A_020650 [Entamoeba histolytica KU27]EMH76337.1 hypothetical protein EHI8A_011400 [Entamoeba histolytica HM-1:IMSS-B]EMS13188.1 hypothetical protein KM1_030390 [Entamoeba histolytica HM-3:IMSS]ENY61608.1 hypothetical protein EHI7A_037410 [Entamoeba histolytica HM-1:IMSS-A]EAL50812.1 hypothetical protein EHI_012120 [Entamoeba histolytica HM-1:IMSS]|eukprot:XP_656196.1 hypothetical protein EHI_012120 [Entamoeba histolytica HM-1:IMSS]
MVETEAGSFIFFAVVDDRLGLKEGTQDEKILYYIAPEMEFETLVISIGHMQTVIGICQQFNSKTKYFRTKLTVTFFVSPQEHIYYMLRVGRTDALDEYLPFLSHLSDSYSMLYNNDYSIEMKPLMANLFTPVFQNYRFNELLSFNYSFFERAVLTHKSYLYLSTIIERSKQEYPELASFVIVYNNSILHSDLSRNDTLTLYLFLSKLIQPTELVMASQELNCLIPEIKNGWVLEPQKLAPIFLTLNNKKVRVFINIYIRKETKSQILFIPIFYKTMTDFFDNKKGFNCETLYVNALKKIISLINDSNVVITKENLPLHLHLSFSTNCLKTNLLIKTKNQGEFLFILFIRRFVELLKNNGCKLSEIWINSQTFQWVASKFGCSRELFLFSRNILEGSSLKKLTEEMDLLTSPIFI